MSPRAAGTALALASAVSFGLMPVLTKVVYDGGADASGVLTVRFAIAAAVLLALAAARREARPDRRTLLGLLGLGALGYGLQSLAYFSAQERIDAGLTAILLYAYPPLVVLLSAVVWRRRPSTPALVCVAAATAGVVLAIGPVSGGQVSGVALGLLAAVVYSAYIVVSTGVTRGVGPCTSAGVICAAAGAFHGVLAVSTSARYPSGADAWLALVGVALVGTVIAIVTFFGALERLGPSDTAVLSTVEPVVSVGVAAALLGERLTLLQVGGGALVLVAVLVLARRAPAPVEVPA